MFLLYAFINLLFVYRYAARAGIDGRVAVVGYLPVLLVMAWVRRRFARGADPSRVSPALSWAVTGVGAVALVALMRQFDPGAIRVARFAALHDWITLLVHGRFPYATAVQPSAFPFLFVCALPFYWLGDLGYFQIAAFVGFAALCLRGPSGATPAALTAVLLLLGSPLFLWEVVVRSELTANMVLVAWFLAWVERRSPGTDEAPPADPPDAGGGLDPGAGLAAGLLLSTRGIVALVDALVFTAVFRRRHGAGARFVAVAALAFLATLVPFLVWDAPRFLANGPFAIQLSYAPLPVVAGAHDWRAVHSRIALLLFAVVAVPFALALETEGVAGVFSRDRFDISYFAFAHSFALLALARPPETRPLQAPAGRGGRTR